ncbi:putative disease resistance protein [Vitis vinifera]|uniref:Putative disease resistance protein n=1 Tax=Vitis vinifera TaxID=29760 RepID=A0A438BNB3_VITVI|nr:putative disease resistance protein [Vitis vinifera]
MRWIGVQFIPDLKTWIRIHSLDFKNSFHPWELDLKNALHPWELGCLKRKGHHLIHAYPNDPNEEYALPAPRCVHRLPHLLGEASNPKHQVSLAFLQSLPLLVSQKHQGGAGRIKGDLGLYPCIEDSNGSPDHSEDQESQSHDPENQSQIWYPHVSEIRGFDRQFSKIRNWLLQSDEGFKDIAIVGIGGSGKTALARQLFYDEHIQGAFFPTLWISLSGKIDADIDLKQVVKDMLVELTTEHGHEKSCSTEEPLSSLGRRLLGKKYLIVLDGIWDETRDWYFSLGQALNWPDRDCNIQFGRDQKEMGIQLSLLLDLRKWQKGWWVISICIAWKALCDGFPLGVKTLAEIIPGALTKDHSGVDAEPEMGHIDSDHYSATQNHRGDTLTEIIPMEVQIDGGGLHCPTCKVCPKTLRHPLASKVAGRLGSKQSWAKKRGEPNNIMAFIHWLASLRPEEKGAQFHFVEFNNS